MARQSEPLAIPQVPVLVTRPRAEAESFAATLSARFGTRVRPLVTPLIAPRFLSPVIPAKDYAAVVFTSAHAVEGARRLGVPLPRLAWCVGRKTAAVATAAGFLAKSADGDAEALANAIQADPPNGRILYLRGVDTRGNLLEKLNSFRIHTDVAIVYAQEPQLLTTQALAVLRSPEPALVTLFSPRTAALFRAAWPRDGQGNLHVAAMSRAVADALDDLPRATLAIARQPDAAGMLAAVESLLAGLPAP
ncbi:uroporphyrinogen-III synthase [Tabrizicola sp.]|mgnify:CR=1 FL=1|jgi:uroporphyrinogen-III synthase|uniref:uroporphyrinogen-III synthase n=1 Tax=Tabrizicola sp. TaxID=2005166 RepID=UPI0035B16ADF